MMPSCPKWPGSKFFIRNDVCITIWCSLAFVGFGTCLLAISPTILDVSTYLGVNLAEMAAIIMVRTIGGAVGGIVTGVLVDKFPKKLSLWILTISALALAIATAALPLSNLWFIFSVFMLLQGAALGSLTNGIHTLLINLWKTGNTSPSIQMIHFMFAIGAFLIPLAATPFISAHLPTHCHLLSTSTYCKNYYPLPANYCTPTNESGLYNASNDECITAPSVKFQYVYWIATIPLLLAVPGLMFYSIKQQCCFDLKKCLKRNVGEKIEEEELTDEQENDEAASHILPYPNTRAFVYTIRFLSACFIFSFIGYEVAFGTYLFAYAVEGKPHFNKKMASILSSLYWGTFAFLRLVSVVLSWCKVPPSVLLTGNLTGNLVASVILLFWPESQIATWVGSALMGTSFASVLPNSIVWLSKTTPVTGKAIAVIGAGALSGEIILPTLVGVFIDILGPRFFPYFSIIAAIVSAVLMFSLFAVARMCKIQPDEEYQTPESEQQRDQSEDTPLIERPQDTVTENTDE